MLKKPIQMITIFKFIFLQHMMEEILSRNSLPNFNSLLPSTV
eukprot:Gb_19675 [translate_table: standard]